MSSRQACSCDIIDLETSAFLAQWDVVGGLLLVYLAIVTPLEVSFLECAEEFSVRWCLDQIANLFFLADLVIQFFIPVSVATRFGRVVVKRKSAIARNYLKSWFAVDCVSVIPFGLIHPCGQSGVGIGWLRAVRLLRLLKLLRLLRGLRIFQRWQTEFSFSLRKITLYQLLVGVLLATHFITCATMLSTRLQRDACLADVAEQGFGCGVSWLTKAQGSAGQHEPPVLGSYMFGSHASMSILVHPHTYSPTSLGERLVFFVLMLCGGFVWTQVISRSTAIFTSLSVHENAYTSTLDDLNDITRTLGLSTGLRRQLRRYFLQTKDVTRAEAWQGLVRRMSPKLQRDTCREVNSAWVLRVRYLSKCPMSLVTDVASAMNFQTFSHLEIFGTIWHMYLLQDGTVALAKGKHKIVATGAVWGTDHMLLTSTTLLSDNTATSVTFTQCYVLAKRVFQSIVDRYPEQAEHFRRTAVRFIVTQGMKLILERMRNEKLDSVCDITKSWRNSIEGDSLLPQTPQDADRGASEDLEESVTAWASRRRSLLVGSRENIEELITVSSTSDHPPTVGPQGGVEAKASFEGAARGAAIKALRVKVDQVAAEQLATTQLIEHRFVELAEQVKRLSAESNGGGAAGAPVCRQRPIVGGPLLCSTQGVCKPESSRCPPPLRDGAFAGGDLRTCLPARAV